MNKEQPTLYRGFNTCLPDGELINKFLTCPRVPVTTNLVVHNIADAWFERSFGVKARSQAIICSTDIEQASSYCSGNGSLAKLLPVGKYKALYSGQVKDFIRYAMDGVVAEKCAVEDWLALQNYQCVDDLFGIPVAFKGEVMLCCERYTIKNLQMPKWAAR